MAAPPLSPLSPSITPSRFASGWFWLTFHLPSSEVKVISMPMIARIMVSM